MEIPPHLLEPGERILWSAQPRQGVRFQRSDWYAVPLTLGLFAACAGLTGISAFSLYAAFDNADHMEIPFLFMFPLIGLAFCVAAYQIAIGRFFRDAATRARTLYALSNKRAFLSVAGPGGYVAFLPVNRDTEFTALADTDGYGCLRFGDGDVAMADADEKREPPLNFEFAQVRDLDAVESIIKRIKDQLV